MTKEPTQPPPGTVKPLPPPASPSSMESEVRRLRKYLERIREAARNEETREFIEYLANSALQDRHAPHFVQHLRIAIHTPPRHYQGLPLYDPPEYLTVERWSDFTLRANGAIVTEEFWNDNRELALEYLRKGGEV
jgi:hypothetical protein